METDGQVATKPYVLLRQALERNSKAAVAKFVWHGTEGLGLLRVVENAIALHALKWPDEIRSPESLAPKAVDISDKEVDEAILLIESMTREEPIADADWATDRYTDALADVIKAKASGKKPPQMESEEGPAGQVVDLMAALEQSVAKARDARGEGAHADVHELQTTALRSTT
ncbi:Ku protein [Streptomyces sp. cg35]|uniref:Ku protein n=1 Tax=Streptomyces sp. cg35 TaxID=3421650 RepID=UPI003D17F117